jgi:RNA polymerase-binding transcription factor DksA
MGISFFAVILIAWECDGCATQGREEVRSEMMSEKVVAQFKKLLLARRLELSRNLNQTVEEVRAAETSEGGEPDSGRPLAPELLQQGTQAQGMLMAMDAALARIASGTFGRCMTCGEEIGSRRLVAFPWIQYCLGCQHIEEKRRQTPVPAR